MYGGYFAVKGELGVDGIVMFILYTQQLSNPLVSISGGLASSQKVKAAAKRVYDILDAEEMQPQTDKMPETADGDVEFKGVDFSYSEDKPLIQNLNFTAKKGQKVAIVGPTGAGKTTIVNLLMRFYDVQKGEILIGGKDIEKADRNSVRSLFSMVLQDAWLFGGTIFENVAYGRDNVTKEEVERACENAYCGNSQNRTKTSHLSAYGRIQKVHCIVAHAYNQIKNREHYQKCYNTKIKTIHDKIFSRCKITAKLLHTYFKHVTILLQKKPGDLTAARLSKPNPSQN